MEQAQKRFMTLLGRYAEENYFYLARNYLGLIKSPFHKQQLTTRLAAFFSQKEIQTQMIALLDEFDLVILSLLKLSGPIRGKEITNLLKDQYSYGILLRRVANLQERMILIADGDQLIFNPLIEQELEDLCSLRPLLGTFGGDLLSTPFCDTEFLRAYLALVQQEQRHTFSEETQSKFAAYEPQRLMQLFSVLSDTLHSLGVLHKDKRIEIDYKKADWLLSLDNLQLLCFLLTATLSPQSCETSMPFFCELISILYRIKSCDTSSLKLLIKILGHKYKLSYCSNVLTALSTFAIITLDEVWRVTDIKATHKRSKLLVDSDQSISYSGSADAHDILYRFAHLEVLDLQKRYVVTKQSIISAFDTSLGYDEIRKYLLDNTPSGMADSLLKQIQMLHQRYEMVQIYDGIVLCGDERMANVVLHLSTLSEHMIKQLSSTIFLMRRDSEDEWRAALASTGQLVGATKRYDRIEILPKRTYLPFQSLVTEATTCSFVETLAEVKPPKIARYDKELKAAIDQANLTAEQKQDHEHRYQVRMLISVQQIAEQVINTSIEAGGFDYQGKVSLARQAAGKKDVVLQIQLTDQELVVQALELAFTAQKEALLKVAVMPEMEVKIIPIRKMFLVRLVRFHLN